MPTAPLRYCSQPGCKQKTAYTYCQDHYRKDRDYRNRFTAGNYGRPWRRERDKFLSTHPWCVECLKEGHQIVATDVDHIVPHRGNEDLFWAESNWQSLCEQHHGQKTAAEAWL